MTTIARDANGNLVQAFGLGTSQKKAFTGTTAQSAAVGPRTSMVRLTADQACYVTFGADPAASDDGTSARLEANTPEYFAIAPGSKIGVVSAGTSGTLFITEAA